LHYSQREHPMPELYETKIDIKTQYIAEQSDPNRNHYAFAYTVTITNTSQQPTKLLSRHWIITNADGKVEEVKGEGVIGEQPHLNPGEQFRYTSGTMLETPLGSMKGTYYMIADDGVKFEAEIPMFTLAKPNVLH